MPALLCSATSVICSDFGLEAASGSIYYVSKPLCQLALSKSDDKFFYTQEEQGLTSSNEHCASQTLAFLERCFLKAESISENVSAHELHAVVCSCIVLLLPWTSASSVMGETNSPFYRNAQAAFASMLSMTQRLELLLGAPEKVPDDSKDHDSHLPMASHTTSLFFCFQKVWALLHGKENQPSLKMFLDDWTNMIERDVTSTNSTSLLSLATEAIACLGKLSVQDFSTKPVALERAAPLKGERLGPGCLREYAMVVAALRGTCSRWSSVSEQNLC